MEQNDPFILVLVEVHGCPVQTYGADLTFLNGHDVGGIGLGPLFAECESDVVEAARKDLSRHCRVVLSMPRCVLEAVDGYETVDERKFVTDLQIAVDVGVQVAIDSERGECRSGSHGGPFLP